jgi:hypothetical protein
MRSWSSQKPWLFNLIETWNLSNYLLNIIWMKPSTRKKQPKKKKFQSKSFKLAWKKLRSISDFKRME